MQKITKGDLEKIIGTSIYGFYIENARIKGVDCCNSDNYGKNICSKGDFLYVFKQDI